MGIEIKYNGNKIEAEIIDYALFTFKAKPYSSQLYMIYKENETITINDKKYKIIEMIKKYEEDDTISLFCRLEEEWV